MINLKAEIEIRTLHQKMDLLIQEQFKKLIESQAEQIKLFSRLVQKVRFLFDLGVPQVWHTSVLSVLL